MSILVIGGNSSIGKIIISKFNREKVIATFHKNNNSLNEEVEWRYLNLANEESIKEFSSVSAIVNDKYDIVIFLSGMMYGKSMAEHDDVTIEQTMLVNFSGQAKLVKCLIPFMNTNSQFIFMSSISAQQGSYDPIYAASKSAMIGFAKSLAIQLAPNIRSNVIAPGLIENSAMYNTMSTNTREKHLASTPTKELVAIDDLANVVYDLSQPHWKSLNGATIDLNGGRYVR